MSLSSRGFGIAGWRRRYCGFDFAGRSRISFSPAPPCENKTTVSPSPSSDAKLPGRKTHKTIPPPRPLACGGVLTCLTKSPHKIENGQSHPCFTHFLLHYYELKIISLPITLHYAISHGLAPRIFHSHL